jgi:hypothetical protein
MVIPRGVLPLLGVAAALSVSAQNFPAPQTFTMLLPEKLLQSHRGVDFEVKRGQVATAPAITPTEPWESWAVFAYNSVVRDPTQKRQFHMYYDCIQATEQGTLGYRRICLATSSDGIEWTKPRLGRVEIDGSTANNVVIDGIGNGNSAFYDESDTNADLRWKMVVTMDGGRLFPWASPDGFKWSQLGSKPTFGMSDTQNVAFFDSVLQQYVLYYRLDLSIKEGHRVIGRCLSPVFGDMNATNDCKEVFRNDPRRDPPLVDIYTSGAFQYKGDMVFLPSFFQQFVEWKGPYGMPNDGLLDIRLLVADSNLDKPHYVDSARNAHSAVIGLDVNRCPFSGSTLQRGGWCNIENGALAKTSRATSARYAAPGYVESESGEEIFIYASAQPFTHNGYIEDSWGTNTGIDRVVFRRDGFVSARGRYEFESEKLPNATTKTLQVPNCTSEGAYKWKSKLLLNIETSVVGWVSVEIQTSDGDAIPGFSHSEANLLKGNLVDHAFSWGTPPNESMQALAGQKVRLAIRMPDAELFSFTFRCEP